MATRSSALAALDVFVGEWSMAAGFDQTPTPAVDARVVFEWLPGEQFLVERWQVSVPEAPDGIAIIGLDPSGEGRYLQHYFDSRGVARVYNDDLGRKCLDAPARSRRLLAPSLPPALHGHHQRRRTDHRRRLGDLP